MDEPQKDVDIEIILRSTGEKCVESWPSQWPRDEYWWTEGNGGCDCNRELFFWRRVYGKEPEDTGFCRGEGRYAIRVLDKATGEVLYEDL